MAMLTSRREKKPELKKEKNLRMNFHKHSHDQKEYNKYLLVHQLIK